MSAVVNALILRTNDKPNLFRSEGAGVVVGPPARLGRRADRRRGSLHTQR